MISARNCASNGEPIKWDWKMHLLCSRLHEALDHTRAVTGWQTDTSDDCPEGERLSVSTCTFVANSLLLWGTDGVLSRPIRLDLKYRRCRHSTSCSCAFVLAPSVICVHSSCLRAPVGGDVQTLAWDPRGERLAITFTGIPVLS